MASLRLNGKVVGFGLVTRYSAGSASLDFGATKKGAAALRQAAKAHRRAIVHITVRDWAAQQAHLRPHGRARALATTTNTQPTAGPGACAGPRLVVRAHAKAALESRGLHGEEDLGTRHRDEGHRRERRAPREHAAQAGGHTPSRSTCRPSALRGPQQPPEPRRPRAFKIVDVTSGEVLAEDVDTRAAIGVLEGLGSVVDVRIYQWDDTTERWILLTLGEHKSLWDYRGKLGPEPASP